jgi:hypothetical protein
MKFAERLFRPSRSILWTEVSLLLALIEYLECARFKLYKLVPAEY